jgi:hypothetical protein
MEAMSNTAGEAPNEVTSRRASTTEFSFVPDTLRSQCRNLIQTFHAMHGYSCLPNILWKAGLSGFIEKHPNLREALRKASTTRSARTANGLFVTIATEVLSLEVLAREYANWSAILPEAKLKAIELLDQSTQGPRTWLMEHYLYPPRYDSPAAAIVLTPASDLANYAFDSGLKAESPRAESSWGNANSSAAGPSASKPSGARSFRDIMLAENPAYRHEAGQALATHTSKS